MNKTALSTPPSPSPLQTSPSVPSMRPAPAALSLLGVFASVATAHVYTLADAYVGGAFFETWQWQTIADPTHGDVNYVDLGTAISQNLTYGTHTSVPWPDAPS